MWQQEVVHPAKQYCLLDARFANSGFYQLLWPCGDRKPRKVEAFQPRNVNPWLDWRTLYLGLLILLFPLLFLFLDGCSRALVEMPSLSLLIASDATLCPYQVGTSPPLFCKPPQRSHFCRCSWPTVLTWGVVKHLRHRVVFLRCQLVRAWGPLDMSLKWCLSVIRVDL